MCGIAGAYHPPGFSEREINTILSGLAHRGPDGNGYFKDDSHPLHLFHTRLSILDLSDAASQPMTQGSYSLTFNGEIYNFASIRKELEQEGHQFASTGDTEVLLRALINWGMEKTLPKLNGMFAFALWNASTGRLSLARDRLGIKPLYYGWSDESFFFASELRPFLKLKLLKASLNKEAIELFLRHNYIPTPHSIVSGFYKLPAGSCFELSREDLGTCPGGFSPFANQGKSPAQYWQLSSKANQSRSLEETVDGLHQQLRDSTRLRMISDVPLGALLSGGIDSSTVVAIMQELHEKPVKTFSIGFHESEFDEANFAKEVAQHLGTEHHELFVTPEETLQVIPQLATMFSEPFADSSQIPTFLVSKLTREHVSVALSGDGGDELLFGYSRYPAVTKIWKTLAKLPKPLRGLLGSVLLSLPQPLLRKFDFAQRLLPKELQVSNFARRAHQLGRSMRTSTAQELYLKAISHWQEPHRILGNAKGARSEVEKLFANSTALSFEEQMMWVDLFTYLPDDILTKVDRASMFASLEARVPILDHNVVEFAWSIPIEQRYYGGETKYPLRAILERYVPRALFERPKMGFGVPIKHWLRNELRDWAESLISKKRIEEQGLLNTELVRSTWDQHQGGRSDWSYMLWDVLMLQAWIDEYEISS